MGCTSQARCDADPTDGLDGWQGLGNPDGGHPSSSEVGVGMLSLVAGGLGGPGQLDGMGIGARFNGPVGMAYGGAGNLFVADVYNRTIRKIVLSTGQVTTLAGSMGVTGNADAIGSAARFYAPISLAADGEGHLFVLDGYEVIRQIVIATGEVTTLAGSLGTQGSADGIGTAAQFNGANGLAADRAGHLFVSDSGNVMVRQIDIATGVVTTFVSTNAYRLVADSSGHLFASDASTKTIKQIVIATGEVSTFAGSAQKAGSDDGPGPDARFSFPAGLAMDGAGDLFVADTGNHTIRKIVVATGVVSTFAGSANLRGCSDGIGAAAVFDLPYGLTLDDTGSLFVTDDNHTIRKIEIATGVVTSLAGYAEDPGSLDGTGAAARFSSPAGIAADGAGNLFVADSGSGTIRKIVIATGVVTTLADRYLDWGSDHRGGQPKPLRDCLGTTTGTALGARRPCLCPARAALHHGLGRERRSSRRVLKIVRLDHARLPFLHRIFRLRHPRRLWPGHAFHRMRASPLGRAGDGSGSLPGRDSRGKSRRHGGARVRRLQS